MKQSFNAKLLARGPSGSWTYIEIPFDGQALYGSKAMVKVKGTINGFAFRTSLMPVGDGSHLMSISKVLLAGARAASGEVASFVIEPDSAPRVIEVPAELEAAFKRTKTAARSFETLSYSHKREYVDWINSAKRQATRRARLAKTV